MHGIVVVARIDGIDSQQLQRAQVDAARKLGRLQVFNLGQHGVGKLVGNAVGVHGNQADLALIVRVAQRLDHARLRHTEAARLGEVVAHQVALLGAALVAGCDRPLPQFLAVDRSDDAAALGARTEDAELALLFFRQPLDRLGLVAVAEDVGVLQPRQSRQDAIALSKRRLARAARTPPGEHQHARPLAFVVIPDRGLADELAVGIARDDLQHRHRRQLATFPEAFAVAAEQTVVGHLRQQPLQGDAVAALY